MAAVSTIDERMLQEDAFITDEKVLLQVVTAKWLGKVPNRRLVVCATDCATEAKRTLSGSEMQKFRWVNPCVDVEEELDLAIA